MLHVVATPIGNLADITLRALRVLAEADVVAAEDTRTAKRLLSHHGIETQLVSYHEHNEAMRTPELLTRLRDGESIALISEAGTPAISDPGYKLVRACIDAGINVEPIPGPSALLAAVVVSGLATDSFVFEGFLSRKGADRRRRLEELATEQRTIVLFEAPHRIDACLTDMQAILGADRPMALCRELTKMHEEVRRGTVAEVIESCVRRPVKGEIVLVIEGAQPVEADLDEACDEVLARLASGERLADAVRAVATVRGVSRRALYDRSVELRDAAGTEDA